MWRDELNAFGIVANSPTLGSLFDHIHYEGHPWLWYVMLWLISQVTQVPVLGLKVVEGLLGIGILLLLGFKSPFSLTEKLLLFSSYFLSFEYVVLARMYSVVVLLLFMYLRVRVSKPPRVMLMAILLGLLACSDAMGLLLSFALIVELFYSSLRSLFLRSYSAIAVFLLLLASSILSARLSPNVSWRTNILPFHSVFDPASLLTATISYIVVPWLPVHSPWSNLFWNPKLNGHYLVGLLIPVVLTIYYFLFRSSRNLLALMTAAILAGVAFGHLVYAGSVRHFGITFLAFLAAIWILRAQRSALPRLALLLLTCSALAGVFAAVGQWRRPFSNAEATASWLRQEHLADAPMAGFPDTSVASIAELLQRPVYFLDCSCSDRFMLFSKRRDSFNESETLDRLLQAGRDLHTSDFLFIDANTLDPSQLASLEDRSASVTLLRSFSGAEEGQENFFVYRVNTSKLSKMQLPMRTNSHDE